LPCPDFAQIGELDRGSACESGGDFLGKREKGFDAAAVLDGKGVEGGVVGDKRGFGLGSLAVQASSEEKKEQEETVHE